ncbi:MAG: transglycosylase domain-containing protein [Deltaproteobacteria bacterium]|nr:transglycosylase domain-containing protein [Deltaproteobacteria bacterium]
MRRLLTPATALVAAAFLVAVAIGWLGWSLLTLPDVAPLKDARATLTIQVRDWKGRPHPLLVGPRNRHWTPLAACSEALIKTVIVAEDSKFFSHDGIDTAAIREAAKANLEQGRYARGASTITQQLAKNLYLSREKTLARKLKEVILARRIDDAVSKQHILELYLNVVELGPLVHGVGHASRHYFGKAPSQLGLRESSLLAAILPGPRIYDPRRNLAAVLARADKILQRMREGNAIEEAEYRAALAEKVELVPLPRLAGVGGELAPARRE